MWQPKLSGNVLQCIKMLIKALRKDCAAHENSSVAHSCKRNSNVCVCVSVCSNSSPHQYTQFAHVDNIWHLHLSAVPVHFSAPALGLCNSSFYPTLIPTHTSPVTALRISRWRSDWSSPHKCEGPWTQPPFSSLRQRGRRSPEWMGTAARSGLHMNESANPWHSALGKWLFMPQSGRSQLGRDAWHVPSLSLTAGDSITSHANWQGAFISRRQPW